MAQQMATNLDLRESKIEFTPQVFNDFNNLEKLRLEVKQKNELDALKVLNPGDIYLTKLSRRNKRVARKYI